MGTETANLLEQAAHEIRSLRLTNEILGAKVEVFDSLMCLLHTKPAEHHQEASIDITYELDKRALEIKRESEIKRDRSRDAI